MPGFNVVVLQKTVARFIRYDYNGLVTYFLQHIFGIIKKIGLYCKKNACSYRQFFCLKATYRIDL